MTDVEFFLVLLIAIAGLARLAGALNVPYPVLLVVGGLAIGFIPGVPRIELKPDLVLLIFLPPLVYHAAFLSSPRALRAQARDVALLSIGLVLATLVTVAVAAHELVGHLTWPEAFVLGAIVAPTDPLAATAVFQRLGAPDRLTTVVEGESLINDGTGLVAFRVALTAVATGMFSFAHAAESFVAASLGGIAIGIAAGFIVQQVRARLDDPPVEITISLFTPYLAYLPADHLGASGVLAAVAAGLFLAYRAPAGLFHVSTRLQAYAFWNVLVFLLNSVLFVLVGLQVKPVLSALGSHTTGFLVGSAVLVTIVVVLTRIAWMFIAGGLARSVGERVVIAWSGMRGAVSLAAALSVPLSAHGRPLILFLTYGVIVGTIIPQGLTLPAVVRRFAPEDTDESDAREEQARLEAVRAALDRLSTLEGERDVPQEALDEARRRYELRLRHLTADGTGEHAIVPAARGIQRELAEVERDALHRLSQDGRLDTATARRLERELDLQDARWGELDHSSSG